MSFRTVSISPHGADGSQQFGGQVRGQLWRGAAGQQVTQQRVELVDRAHPGLGQVHTPFVQEGQRRGVILGREIPPFSLQISNGGCGRCVYLVVLTPSTAGKFAHPAGRRGRHVDDALTAGDEPLGEMPAQAVGVLHSPLPLWPPLGPGQQPPVVRQTGLDPHRPDLLVRDRLDGGGGVGGLVWVDTEQYHGT